MNPTTADLKPADAQASTWVDKTPEALRPYLRLMRLDRPTGTWLLFWPCVFGLILGAIASERQFAGWHDLTLLILFGIGSLAMRGAGCTYNDIVDREIDARVARTRGRPIPSGAVTLRDAWLFLIAQCLVGLAVLLQLNRFAVLLGAASLLLIAAYPFMKRITWWPQAWLGLTFNWGALLGFAAQTEMIDWADAMLYAGLFFWTLGYDTIYALQDKEDDALVGVRSSALALGGYARLGVALCYLAALALWAVSLHLVRQEWFALLALLPIALHLLGQAATLRPDNGDDALAKFRSNRTAGFLMFLACLVVGNA